MLLFFKIYPLELITEKKMGEGHALKGAILASGQFESEAVKLFPLWLL